MRILAITDLSPVGSGYASISLPILTELHRAGHEVKCIGLLNNGKQHNFPFSIIPAKTISDALAMIQRFWSIWTFDAVLVLFDLTLHDVILNKLNNRPFKYLGVFPVEADPLSYAWAMTIIQMDQAFVISEFGKAEVTKKGITNIEHLPIGIDTLSWQPPTDEEKSEIRKAYGISDDTFVILTVADNQERKNFPANFYAVKDFSREVPDCQYVLVTREKLQAGWNIRELADTIGISDKLTVIERGKSFRDLWSYYAIADAMLLLSKAEGLGNPVLEAMAMNVPVVGTNCTGIRELLSDDRGFLVEYEYMHIDPFGNGHRYWADASCAAKSLLWIKENKSSHELKDKLDRARNFVRERTWERAVSVILKYLESAK